MDALWAAFSPSHHLSLDTFSQAKVLYVPGKRELTVPAREAPPTVETCFMELGVFISWVDPPLRGVLPAAWVGNIINKLCSRSADEK